MDFIISTIIIVATVLFIFWISEQKQKWIQQILNWFPAILFAYVIPATITHVFRIDLSKVYWHSISRNWIIPFAIVTVMSALSITQLKKVGVKPIVLFVSGSLLIAIFPILAIMLLKFFWPSAADVFTIQGYWRGLVPIVGSWIGGSTSQLVLKELVDCPNDMFLSVVVLDNILVNIWTILMFQAIKRSDSMNSWMGINSNNNEVEIQDVIPKVKSWKSLVITVISIAAAVILMNRLTNDFLLQVILLSIVGLLLGNLVRQWHSKFVLKSGSILILIIMAILGLRLDFSQFLLPFPFLILCIVWIVMHFVVLLIVAKLLNLHSAWVAIASMANVGGISTAPAVTAAYNKVWMPHAILLAILSMATGNLWGMLTIFLFQNIL